MNDRGREKRTGNHKKKKNKDGRRSNVRKMRSITKTRQKLSEVEE
jgi:hypothetical protein